MDKHRFLIGLQFSIQDSHRDRRYVVRQSWFPLSVKVATKRQRQRIRLVAVRARNGWYVFRYFIHRLKCNGLYVVGRMSRVYYSIRATSDVDQMIVTIVGGATVTLRQPGRSKDQATAMVGPAKRKSRVLRLLQNVFRRRSAYGTANDLHIGKVRVGSITLEFKVRLINCHVPARYLFNFQRLSNFPGCIFRRRVDRMWPTGAVSMVIGVPPATAVDRSLINCVIVRHRGLLLRFFPSFQLYDAVVVNCNGPPRRVGMDARFCTRFDRRVFVPV